MTKHEQVNNFSKSYSEWLTARGEVYSGYAEDKDPSSELTDREFDAYNATLTAPVTYTCEIEHKIRMLLIDDAGDRLDDDHIQALNFIVRDLIKLRTDKRLEL